MKKKPLKKSAKKKAVKKVARKSAKSKKGKKVVAKSEGVRIAKERRELAVKVKAEAKAKKLNAGALKAERATGKKAAAKVSKKPRPKSAKPKVAAETDVADAPRRGRPPIYDTTIEKMRKMTPGDSFVLTPPKGRTADWLNNSVTVAVCRARNSSTNPLNAPKGCVFKKTCTPDNKLMVECVKLES